MAEKPLLFTRFLQATFRKFLIMVVVFF